MGEPTDTPAPGLPFLVAGETLHPCLFGALWWPSFGTLIVADLHFETGSRAAARERRLLPPYDTLATLARLEAVFRARAPRRLVCLGDSFHDPGGPDRLAPATRDRLGALAAACELVWVAGNHDPHPPGLPGRAVAELRLGPLVLRHEATGQEPGEIAGHLHPKARIPGRAGRVTGRCFVWSPERAVLPAFGALTGGLDVTDRAFRPLFPGDFGLDVIGRLRLVRLPGAAALPGAPMLC